MLRNTRNTIVEKVSQRHIVGTSLRDALPVLNWAAQQGFGLILSPWAGPGSSSKVMFQECMDSLDVLEKVRGIGEDRHPQLRNDDTSAPVLSVKLNAFDFDNKLISELYQYALGKGVRLHIDSLSPELAPQTFRLLEELVKRFGLEEGSGLHRDNRDNGVLDHQDYVRESLLGVTIPSRWVRSQDDLQRAVELGIAIRIVKGQWSDPDRAVDPLENSLKMLRSIQKKGNLQSQPLPISMASHDVTYLRENLSQLKRTNFLAVLEQFFSLPLNGQTLAEEFRIPFSIYIAYGSPALPYNIRFSLTRPQLALWMASDYLLPKKRFWEKG